MKSENLIKQLKKGNPDKIKKFLQDNPMDLNIYDKKSGKNIVQLAIQSQQPQIFYEIISKPGINFNMTDQKGQQTILQTAILLNKQQFVQKILEKHANPNNSNSKGYNALHTAVMQNLPRMIQILLKTKLQINIKCFEGNILNLAIVHNSQEVALWILENQYYQNRLDITIKDNLGNNCLLLAVQNNLTSIVNQIIKKLKKSKLSQVQKQLFINCQNKEGDTSLHIAYRSDHQNIIKLLEQNEKQLGLNKQLKNLKGETIKDIVSKRQVLKQNEKQIQEKLKQEKKMRQKQKQAQKTREAQRILQQQKLQKQRLKLLQQQTKATRQQQLKSTRIKFLIGSIIVIIVFYFVFQHGIQKKKAAMPVV